MLQIPTTFCERVPYIPYWAFFFLGWVSFLLLIRLSLITPGQTETEGGDTSTNPELVSGMERYPGMEVSAQQCAMDWGH